MSGYRPLEPLKCPDKSCDWIVYSRLGMSRQENKKIISQHLHHHWIRQFSIRVFIWRLSGK